MCYVRGFPLSVVQLSSLFLECPRCLDHRSPLLDRVRKLTNCLSGRAATSNNSAVCPPLDPCRHVCKLQCPRGHECLKPCHPHAPYFSQYGESAVLCQRPEHIDLRNFGCVHQRKTAYPCHALESGRQKLVHMLENKKGSLLMNKWPCKEYSTQTCQRCDGQVEVPCWKSCA